MREGAEIIAFAAVLAVVEQQVAGRAGISTGSLRVLTRISTLIETGATVRAADVVAAKAAAPSETRQNLKRLLASKHLERRGGPVKGRLLIPEEGRRVLAELVRGIQRARKQLMSFEPCPPFRRVVPKKATKLPDDAQKGKEGETHDPEVPLSPNVQDDLPATSNVARAGESEVG